MLKPPAPVESVTIENHEELSLTERRRAFALKTPIKN
jgi:hypothetical protein